ncbi:MAG: EAL domain-containing protein [Rhizobiaceae bacterium]
METNKNDSLPGASLGSADDSMRLLMLAGMASYAWDVRSDRIEWSSNANQLFGLTNSDEANKGRNFEKLIAAEGSQSRYGLIFSQATAGCGKEQSYQCVYALAANNVESGEAVWVEDTGMWHPGEDGRPVRAEGVVRIITDRRKREENLRRKSDFDDLTGLPNRRYLEVRTDEVIKECRDDHSSSALLVISIARMDLINEIYGFQIGDEVLRSAGKIISSLMRGSDTTARMSGAKFGVILRNCSGKEVYIAARRFLDGLRKEVIRTSAGPVSLNAAVGACYMPRHASTATAAIAAASQACTQSVFDKGYRIGVFDRDPGAVTSKREEAETAIRIIDTCETGAMHLAYQPVVDSTSGKVAFHECLIRITDESGKNGTAGSFVPVAEKLGFIGLVDHKTLELALDVLRTHPTARLSINVSYETAEDPMWLSKLADGLNRIEGGAARMIVEITESHAAKDIDEARKFVEMVKSLGCKVAIDDFGAGFTSFANLKALSVDIIKIDGSFATDLLENRQNQVFIQSLIMLAKAFDVKTVVEWVEDTETATMLAGWGVDYLQGNVFGFASIANQWMDAPLQEHEIAAAARLAG